MKYVFYNLRNLLKNEKFILALMLVCVFVSAWAMTFSYGLYQNYNSIKIEGETVNKEINVEVAEGEILTRGEFKTYLDSLPDTLLDDIYVIYCMSHYEYENADGDGRYDAGVISRFTVHGGAYKTSSYLVDLWEKNGMLASGRFFSDEEEMNGVNSVMIEYSKINDPKMREQHKKLFIDNDTVTLFGESYNIIGTHSSIGVIAPFLSVPAKIPVDGFTLAFENVVSRSKYDTLLQRANETVPGKMVFPELPFPDEEQIYIYNNVMVISGLIAALTISNIAFLYIFILKKRYRQLSIMRICGCTAIRSWATCIGECCIICIPVFFVGILTYIPFMHGVLSGIFEYMEDAYSPAVYTAIFIIYVAMLLLIMGIVLARQIVQELSQVLNKEVG